jgi:peroxiredoxin
MNSTRQPGSLFLFLLLFCLFFSNGPQAEAATKMPQFALPSARDGKVIDSNSFKDKALLVTFFATWCPPCIQEVPAMISLQDEFKDKGFSVIGIAVDQGGDKAVKRLIDKMAINYPVVMADSKVIADFGGVYGIPASFLINQHGNVVKKYPGAFPHTIFSHDIKNLFK